MKQFSVLLFSIGILAISLYGLSTNSYYVHIFLNLSVLFIYIRLALVAILLTYVFVPSFRIYTTRALLSVSGFLMLALGFMSIASPSLLGYMNPWMLLGDSFTLIEIGIFSIVFSAELSAERSSYIANGFTSIQSLFARPSEEVAYVLSAKEVIRDGMLSSYRLNSQTDLPAPKQLVNSFSILINVPP